MCGIFGAVDRAGYFEPGDALGFRHATDLVRYRGPGGCGFPSFCRKQPAGHRFDAFLGHRRLAILDLSEAAAQPMSDGVGLHISFNGQIFNYIELRRELHERGYEFRSGTDTEAILKLHREEGVEDFAQLNGMWAFAILDEPRKQVVLSRDRFDRMLQEMGVLDDAGFLAFYDKFLQGKRVFFMDISRVLIAEKWAQAVFRRSADSLPAAAACQ